MSADEIRRRIIDTVVANGGHLASSLGAVELAIALRKTFDPEKDRVLWDVGHQAYAWKILTGRADRFDTLRQLDGIAPFPLPSESSADPAVAGHAGSALSVALGMAAARDAKGTDEQVVAVVGDASMACGHSFEALNHASVATRKLILVINDNRMSISGPVGALSKLFGRILASRRYNLVKTAAENAGHQLGLTFLRGIYHVIESRLKGVLLGSRFFEKFGFRYIGPVDGHDVGAMVSALTVARRDKRSVVIHVSTVKGKGYAPAEADPSFYHGVGGGRECGESWSSHFSSALTAAARKNSRIVALTAAMKNGTGLSSFAEEFPRRFFDCGIAEGHLVSMAAGLAAGGMRPVVAIYSTFLQRAIDQIIHDVAIAKLPVVFCVDRAGVVGADGVTHHGLYDLALLRSIPNLVIAQPKDAEDLGVLLAEALERSGPTVIRYPRGSGCCYDRAREIAAAFPGAEAVHARYLKPLDVAPLIKAAAEGRTIVTIENAAVNGGLGVAVREALPASAKVVSFGWPDKFIPHGSVKELESRYGLDTASIVSALSSQAGKDMLVYG